MSKRQNVSMVKNHKEIVLLIMYTIHIVCMLIASLYYEWPNWENAIFLSALISSWMIFITGKWDAKGRSIYVALMVNVCIVVYALSMDSFKYILVPFAAIILLTSMYENADLQIIPTVSFTVIIFFHGLVLHTYSIASVEDVHFNLIPIGNIYFIIMLIRYETIKKLHNKDQVNKAIEDLVVAEHSKDDFLANVSHEIRTPINTISGMSEVILREDLEADLREKIEDIQTSSRRLLTVVNDLLDFSELNSGKQSIIEKPYNLTSTINDVISLANAWKADKNIELVVDCDAAIPKSLIGDEQKIKRVILNFVDNAIKFTNDGCITIYFSHRVEYYGINLCVSVKDTGIGLDSVSREKLFSSFNQVDTKRNRQEGGIGLGLAISQKIVEQMGGFISVKSELGKGSEFQFVIPQKIQDNAPLIQLENPSRVNVLLYINMEQFDMLAIRDAYTNNIIHIGKQLNIKFHMCRNLAEFKRRVERDYFSDLFISWEAYLEDKNYFDELSKTSKVVLVIDKDKEKYLENDLIVRLYKPLYILPVVSLLKGISISKDFGGKLISSGEFVAPEAKVLIVDDNFINLKVVSALLKPYKMHITTALSGAEALEKIESKDYDLVFMDHMMPEMDGVECLHRIRNKGGLYFREVPIIALTANAVAGAREMFLEEGFQEFVAKPIEVSILDKVIRGFLSEDKLIPVSEDDVIEEKKEANIIADTRDSENVIEKDTRESEKISKSTKNEIGFDFQDVEVDVSQGIMYCGSKEDYLEILKLQYEDGAENRKKIVEYYTQEDWKNYVILVHGVKSSMKSVGIGKLSEMCKGLEFAGKEDRIEYIHDNHEKMLKEYDQVMRMLAYNLGIEENDLEDLSDVPEISSDDFDTLIEKFEDAVYTWESENMVQIVNELQKYQYKKMGLSIRLDGLYKKIEMSDYMSALDMLKRLKKKIDEE